MTDATPNHRDADDAHADDNPPTDAVTDEVKADAARVEDGPAPTGAGDDRDFPEEPSISHP